jgi:hypothetical protein
VSLASLQSTNLYPDAKRHNLLEYALRISWPIYRVKRKWSLSVCLSELSFYRVASIIAIIWEWPESGVTSARRSFRNCIISIRKSCHDLVNPNLAVIILCTCFSARVFLSLVDVRMMVVPGESDVTGRESAHGLLSDIAPASPWGNYVKWWVPGFRPGTCRRF